MKTTSEMLKRFSIGLLGPVAIGTLALASTLSPGCEGSDTLGQSALLSSWGQSVILPNLEAFYNSSEELETAAEKLCAAPNEANLSSTQDAWNSARGAWKKMDVFAFGPVHDPPLRAGPKIDFWPLRVDTVEGILQDDSTIDGAALPSPARGLPVIEYILFRDGAISKFAEDPRACDYLLAMSAQLTIDARNLADEWSPSKGNYLAEMTEADGDPFESSHAALGEVVNRMAFTVEDIRVDKLGRPLGDETGGSPQPEKAESWVSGRSIDDIGDALLGIEELYFDQGSDNPGLSKYGKDRGQNFDDQFAARLLSVRNALAAIEEPLTDAIVSSPESVRAAMDELTELQRLIQVDMIAAFSLVPTFNDNDGD